MVFYILFAARLILLFCSFLHMQLIFLLHYLFQDSIAFCFDYTFFSDEMPKIIVSDIPKTNVLLGLDLSGGARALVKAKDADLTSSELSDLIDTTRNRFNVYGLEDVKILPVSDLSGDHFMLIEIAGATPGDLEELVAQQGKFEAKIGDEIVFIGGERDVADVCKNDATCAGVRSCDQAGDGTYFCNFE